MQHTSFVFRECVSPEDLRASFALRYEIYSQTPGLCHFDSLDPASRLDVDGFDRYSRHYGVFESSYSAERLLGGLRVTGLAITPHVEAVCQALAGETTALAHFEQPRPVLLPALSYSVERERIASFASGVQARAESFVEGGRLVIAPEVRSIGAMGGLRLARGVIAAVVAQVFFVCSVPHAIINCRTRHGQFYAPFGFRALGDRRIHTEPTLDGIPAVLLHGRPEWVIGDTRSLCLRMAKDLATIGHTVLATSRDSTEDTAEAVAA